MLHKYLTQFLIAALVGCLSAYLTAQLYHQWISEDAARERERINNHAKNTKEALEIYGQAHGFSGKQKRH